MSPLILAYYYIIIKKTFFTKSYSSMAYDVPITERRGRRSLRVGWGGTQTLQPDPMTNTTNRTSNDAPYNETTRMVFPRGGGD
jgi:hypothetical protein